MNNTYLIAPTDINRIMKIAYALNMPVFRRDWGLEVLGWERDLIFIVGK